MGNTSELTRISGLHQPVINKRSLVGVKSLVDECEVKRAYEVAGRTCNMYGQDSEDRPVKAFAGSKPLGERV